jgi:hypothetical protein
LLSKAGKKDSVKSNGKTELECRVNQLLEEAMAEKKRRIIGSIFPEKLTFYGLRFQTSRLNEGARLIYTLN